MAERLTDIERREAVLLLVEPDAATRANLLSALGSLGLSAVDECAAFKEALRKIGQKQYSHLIFSTTQTDMEAVDFLARAMRLRPDLAALPSSANPDVDQVYDLLMLGARSYLITPVSADNLDQVLAAATHAVPIPDAMLKGKDRNRAIAGMLLDCLDQIAAEMREARDLGREPVGLADLMAKFRETAEMARAFCRGGELELVDTVMEYSIEKADEVSITRLGRIRQRLQVIREQERKERQD